MSFPSAPMTTRDWCTDVVGRPDPDGTEGEYDDDSEDCRPTRELGLMLLPGGY
jgi:hypothetical protein